MPAPLVNSQPRCDTVAQELCLYLCALVVRCAFILAVHWEPANDAGHYIALAKELVHEHAYSSTAREPGFPVYVAGLYLLAGDDVRSLYLLQALVASLLPVFAYRLYRNLLPESGTAAFWLALLVAVHPELASFSGVLYREALVCVLWTWLALRMVLAIRRPSLVSFSLVGFLSGVCCLVRSDALLFFVIFASYALVRCMRDPWPPRARSALLGLACILVLIAPWLYRNYCYQGFFGLSSVGGAGLFARTYHLDRQGQVEPRLRALAEQVIREENLDLSPGAYQRYLVVSKLQDRVVTQTGEYSEADFHRRLLNIAQENVHHHPGVFLLEGVTEFRSLFGGYSWYWAFPRWTESPPLRQAYRERMWGWLILKALNGGVFPVLMWTLLAASLLYRPGSGAWWDSLFLLVGVMTFCVSFSAISNVENRHRDAYEAILFALCFRGYLGLTSSCRKANSAPRCNAPACGVLGKDVEGHTNHGNSH
jgi:hypothetical protein